MTYPARTHKYARVERERRFLLRGLPAALEHSSYERLRDCYLTGTQLRLRRVETPTGERLRVKLGQKRADPDAPGDPRRRLMTTIYLDEGEAQPFAALPGLRSTKRRYRMPEQGRTFVIDVYEEPPGAAGTVVAEVECDSDAELEAIAVPAWAERDVTADPTWTGSQLASLGAERRASPNAERR